MGMGDWEEVKISMKGLTGEINIKEEINKIKNI